MFELIGAQILSLERSIHASVLSKSISGLDAQELIPSWTLPWPWIGVIEGRGSGLMPSVATELQNGADSID
jgi:hypothetical protein